MKMYFARTSVVALVQSPENGISPFVLYVILSHLAFHS